jgi:hypothetical protein
MFHQVVPTKRCDINTPTAVIIGLYVFEEHLDHSGT